jgi:hypothetical protein
MQGAPCREWLVLSKRCNTAGDHFPARPKGANQKSQYGVTALNKDLAIVFELRLVLAHLVCSEHANSALSEHQSSPSKILSILSVSRFS